MTSIPPPVPSAAAAFYMPHASWPNYDLIITEDNKPADSFYDGMQMRLLTAALLDSWAGPGDNRPFLAAANVALFYSFNEPPIVPDMMLSLDVVLTRLPKNRQRSYFVWELGKSPDAAVEIVSGTDGEELGEELHIYERIGIPYYVVWDPRMYLSDVALHCFVRQGSKYEKNGPRFPQIGLGVTEWRGEYETLETTWLRWCDAKGVVIPTGGERAKQEQKRAEQEKERAEAELRRAEHEQKRADQEKYKAEQEQKRAEQEKERADKLAEKLRSLGIDPEAS
jgi:Uma2 family endonuclease